MRYAVISDIHSNLEAFEAVADAIADENVDRYLCLGDIVGYGADPKACIALLRSLAPEAIVAGNHDWGAVDLTDTSSFNDVAIAAITWTKRTLSSEEADFLRSLELTYVTDNMTLVHGTLDDPAAFGYVLGTSDAYAAMKLQKTPLCFIGHSHVAEIFSSDGVMMEDTTRPIIEIDPANKYIINVGSVGQPRDGDNRASYVIYDDKRRTVEMKRAQYDIEKAQAKIIKAGLPGWLAERLADGR